jgi:hypothetical protein
MSVKRLGMHVAREDIRRSFTDAPVRRTAAELYCLTLVLRPHANNSDARKAGTIILVGVWALIEVGAAFGVAALPEQFFFLRVLVGVLIGRMWGIEINNFAGVEFHYEGENDD